MPLTINRLTPGVILSNVTFIARPFRVMSPQNDTPMLFLPVCSPIGEFDGSLL